MGSPKDQVDDDGNGEDGGDDVDVEREGRGKLYGSCASVMATGTKPQEQQPRGTCGRPGPTREGKSRTA